MPEATSAAPAADSSSKEVLITKTIEDFINFGPDYLYNLETKQENLFWAGSFGELDTASDSTKFKNSTEGDGSRYMPDACFRIQEVNINLPSITFAENKLTHASDFQDLNYNRTFDITWIEDVYRSITKYHLDWILYGWYHRPSDALKTGPGGKFRHLEVCQWHWFNGIPTPIFVVILDKIKPQGSGGSWKFGMGQKGDPLVKIQYVADEIQIVYMDKIDGIDINGGSVINGESSTKVADSHLLNLNVPDSIIKPGYTENVKRGRADGGYVDSWRRMLRTLQIEDPNSEGFIS